MNRWRTRIPRTFGWLLLGGVAGICAQDVMQQRLPFLKVLAENGAQALKTADSVTANSAIR